MLDVSLCFIEEAEVGNEGNLLLLSPMSESCRQFISHRWKSIPFYPDTDSRPSSQQAPLSSGGESNGKG